MKVTSYMMDYLIGKEEVSIETECEGRTCDFFNEQDRLHMEDVKNLFLGGLKLRTVMLLPVSGPVSDPCCKSGLKENADRSIFCYQSLR